MGHKSGFVNIVGNPNVGKSTLMNAMIGERLSIITSKAQTTRHRIHGIVSTDDYQIVFSDTPGVLKPNYKLQESMLAQSKSALVDADILLYVTDVLETTTKNLDFIESVNNIDVPVLVVLNKIDLMTQELLQTKITEMKKLFPKAEITCISALHGANISWLFEKIVELLPEGPPYFDKGEITDRNQRFFVSEIIREKILLLYQEEIPYSCEVGIEEYKESPTIDRIRAIIYVIRDSQKGIIIGDKGLAIKKLGIESRKEIEKFIGKQVFLDLYVKVDPDWRDKERSLQRYGYINK
jgi:GTP-binding protein Era